MSTLEIFECGVPDTCSKGGEHQWDGPWEEHRRGCHHCEDAYNPDPACMVCKGDPNWSRVSGGTSTCSKCGVDALSHGMWNGP